MNSSIIIFTDGSSRGNPGRGGWGTVVVNTQNKIVAELGGNETMTTNNRMEIRAAIEGLVYAKKYEMSEGILSVAVLTDSSYLINGITKWIHGWKRNNWQTKTKDDVLNKDLWMELLEAVDGLSIQWKYVGGHVGVLGNERCDFIATSFADGQDIKLFIGPMASYELPDILNISFDEAKSKERKSSSSRSKAPAFSYVSMVGGLIETHRTWAECEKRVKGAKGAKFKKAVSAAEQAQIISEFGFPR